MRTPKIARVGEAWTRWVVVTVGLLCATVLVRALMWTDSRGQRRYVLFDDAMISLSYARSLARGGGLVWYVGAAHVQGITNPGWTLVMTPVVALTSSTTTASLLISTIGLATLIGAALVAHQLARAAGPLAQTAVGIVCVAHFPLLYWSVRGMEVGALLLLLLCAVLLVSTESGSLRSDATLVAVLVVGVMVRFDFVLVGCTLAVLSYRDRRRASLVALSAFSSAVVVLVAQRTYYHQWLPNTYALKMSGGPLSERLAAGAESLAAHPQGVILAALALWAAGRSDRRVVMLATIVLVINAYNVWVGGDSWEYFSNRYHALSLPIAAIAVTVAMSGRWLELRPLVVTVAAWCVAAEWRLLLPNRAVPSAAVQVVAVLLVLSVVLLATRPGAASFAAVVILVSSSSGWLLDVGRGTIFDHDADRLRVEQALALREVSDPSAVVAVAAAGTIVFEADRRAVDLLGKSDPRIAQQGRRAAFFPGHDKWDLSLSVGEDRPDVVVELVGDLDEAAAYLEGVGYERLCPSGRPSMKWFVRTDSTLIRREALDPC